MMDPHDRAKRNHAAQVLCHHADGCLCDLCKRAVAVLRGPARNAPPCHGCGGAIDCKQDGTLGPDIGFCRECLRQVALCSDDTCPACEQFDAIVIRHHVDRLACVFCGWSGSVTLLVANPYVPPPVRVFCGSFIPF